MGFNPPDVEFVVNEGKTIGNVQCDHVKKKSSKAESFKQMNIKYPTHLKMAMLAETCSEKQ
jgi:hypothetical protein